MSSRFQEWNKKSFLIGTGPSLTNGPIMSLIFVCWQSTLSSDWEAPKTISDTLQWFWQCLKISLTIQPPLLQEREKRRNIFHKAWVQAGSAARQDRCCWGDVETKFKWKKKVKAFPIFDSPSRWFSTVPYWSTVAMLLPWLLMERAPSSLAVEIG